MDWSGINDKIFEKLGNVTTLMMFIRNINGYQPANLGMEIEMQNLEKKLNHLIIIIKGGVKQNTRRTRNRQYQNHIWILL